MNEPKLSETISSLLRCPVTQQSLRWVAAEELGEFDGDFPEGGFLSEDLSRAYPVKDGFPLLIKSAAVTLTSKD